MDIARPRRRTLGFGAIVPVAGIVALGIGAWYAVPTLLHGAPALPSVARASIIVDIAKTETLVRAVRASGTLVPDRIHVVATSAEGLVASVAVRAGNRVEAGATIAELRNPDLDAAVADASAQLVAANAELRSAREVARASRLDRDGAYRTATAEAQRAHEEAATDTSLAHDGLIGTLAYRQAAIKANETRALAAIASRQIGVDEAGEAAKVAVAQAAVDRAAATLAADRARVGTLVVRAGIAGIVQSVTADVGQRASPGTELARIAEERDLKAVLQVAEGDMRGVAPGMRATLDTNGSGTLAGYVARIAPVAVNGSIAVDVTLDRIRPGIRPAQNVDGTIELSRLHRALTIARPAGALDEATISLFRVTNDGTRAIRTRVRLGGGSLDRVEARSGLAPGTSVIVSDTSAFDKFSELRITPN